MGYINSSEEFAEKAYLVGISIKGSKPLLPMDDSLEELSRLAATADIEVVGQISQQLVKPNAATFIGTGKLEELKEALAITEANVVIFDDELSPRHQREIEKVLGEEIKVIDRSALILDIFARHAQTREGALQVELAQYEYRLPRLTRQWTHLARQSGGGAARAGGGGVGLRGPGETQLEVDRREITRRISKLKKDLDAVRAHRQRHRQQRKQAGITVAALVGYTNAGKSTLLNTLANADVYAADQLFATLDPTTRRISLESGQAVLCSDTVGFIQKLPTSLIAAFRATLEEITEADIIIHVADASHINVFEQIDAVEDTLAEIESPEGIPRILVLNKMDITAEDAEIRNLTPHNVDYDMVIQISAKEQTGLANLLLAIEMQLAQELTHVEVLVPYTRGDLVATIHEQCVILDKQHTEEGVLFTARIDTTLLDKLRAQSGLVFH